MPRICATTPRDENGKPVKVRCLASAINFMTQFFGLADGSASFTRYMTVNGYSSYKVVKEQPSQGLLKASLADVYELKRRASNGDPESINALFVLNQYIGDNHHNLKASA